MADQQILFITNGSPTYMPPLRLGERQVEMGPNMPDATTVDGRIRRFLKAGDTSADALLASLPEDFLPDLTFIQASSYRCAKPFELARMPGRKFLVIADLHHGTQPIRTMQDYLIREPFDAAIVLHTPQHAHWFDELEICPVAVIPNFNVAGHKAPFQTMREPTILFIGQASDLHPRRRHLLNAIKAAGLPLVEGQAEPDDAARLYGQAQIVFNCSLNGDVNMRIFEVLAAGGCLVTDRLSPRAGLDDLFTDCLHLSLYDDVPDLILLLKRLLANPMLALTLAENGAREYWTSHAPDIRKRQVLDFVRRCKPRSVSKAFPKDDLIRRALLYERLQDVQRSLLSPTPFLVDPDIPEEAWKDTADLQLLRPTPWSDDPISPCIVLASERRPLSRQEGRTIIPYSPLHQG